MHQRFNEIINHPNVSENEQSAIVLKQLAEWLARCTARNIVNNQTKTDETIH